MSDLKLDLADLKLKLIHGDRNIFHEKLISLSPAIIIHVETGAIVYASESVNLMFGYIINELEGMPVESLMPEEFRKRHAAHLNNYLKIPKQRNMGVKGMVLQGQKKDGSVFDIKISLYPFMEDRVLFALGFIMEV